MRRSVVAAGVRARSGSLGKSLAGGLVLALAGGCATPTRVLRGDGALDVFAVSVAATCDGKGTVAVLTLENRADAPIGLDVDLIGMRAAQGAAVKALGKLQTFRKGSEKRTQRVPHGPLIVEPHGKTEISLDFPTLPDRGPSRLTLPAAYQLGIEGQVPLQPLEVVLVLDEKATKLAARDAFFDPFVE